MRIFISIGIGSQQASSIMKTSPFILAGALLVLILLSSSQVAASVAPGGNWPSFTYDYSNSRYQASSTVNSSNVATLTQKWMIPTRSSISSTPVVLNGSVYFADWSGDVYSANVSTGKVLWKVNLGFPISSSIALGNGLAYVAGGPFGPTKVFALNQTTGVEVWNVTLNTAMNAIYASPIVYNGRLFIGASDTSNIKEDNPSLVGEIDALNATNGAQLWRFLTAIDGEGGAGVWGSVAVDPVLNAIYFGTGNAFAQTTSNRFAYSILSLNAASGQLNWSYQVYANHKRGGDKDFGSSANLFSVTINGVPHQAVGLGGKDGIYYILDRVTGQFLEKAKIGDYTNGGIRGLAGYEYLPSGDPMIIIPSDFKTATYCCANITALLPASNTIAWTFTDRVGSAIGSVALVHGAVFFGDTKGNLYALDSTSGKQLFKTHLPYGIYGGVTVAEGLVLVGNFDTNLGSNTRLGLYAFAPR
jgi:polyvinyl alcohol dehydrogenase (cytochrome)